MSKLRQALVLRKYGILTPRTVLGVGVEQIVSLARTFSGPFITKHNQGGKGLGITHFENADALKLIWPPANMMQAPTRKSSCRVYPVSRTPNHTGGPGPNRSPMPCIAQPPMGSSSAHPMHAKSKVTSAQPTAAVPSFLIAPWIRLTRWSRNICS